MSFANIEIPKRRVGNTIGIKIVCKTNGEAVSLVGRDIYVTMKDPSGISRSVPFTLDAEHDNIVKYTFEGKDQDQALCGVYVVTVFENRGHNHQAVFDRFAFELVPYSHLENDVNDGLDDTEIELSGDLSVGASDGYTPYIGLNGNWWINDEDTHVKADYSGEEADREQRYAAAEEHRNEQYSSAEQSRNGRYQDAEDARDVLYQSAERNRNDAYGVAENERNTRYQTAEGSRNESYFTEEGNRNARYNTKEGLRDTAYSNAEQHRNDLYTAEEGNRDSSYGTAEGNRNNQYNSKETERDGKYDAAEREREGKYNTAEGNRNDTYQQKETLRDTSYSTAEGQRNDQYQTAEGQRNTQYQSAEAQRSATLNQLNQDMGGVKDRMTAVETAVRDLEELFGESVEGYVRVAETSDPVMGFREYKHTKAGEESVFDVYKPCLVGNNFTPAGTCGKILHILNPLNWYKDIHGNTRLLDGSEGEVLICNVETIYGITGHVSVGGVNYDVFLRSRIPFEWSGHKAEVLPPTGLSPHYCVSHLDSDNVTRMHSVLNMDWNGTFDAQTDCVGKFVATMDDEGVITETYDGDAAIIGDAKGKHSTDISLPNGEQYAMNINDDTTKTVPYYNSHVDAIEKHHVGLMLAEGGTFYLHAATEMGSGFCSNVQATTAARWAEDCSEASNGFRYIKHDGETWGYYPLGSNANFGTGTTGDRLYKACMLNLWRSPWNIFEQQRVLMFAITNHIDELTWFAYEGNIYKYRSVPGLAGPSQGVMTAVVWKKLASKLVQGCVEPGTENDVSGNRCEWLISSCVYRGVITDVSPSWWTSGLWMTQWGTDNRYEGWLCRDQSKMLKSNNSSTVNDTTVLPQEESEDYIQLPTLTYGNGYRKNYSVTLFWSDKVASQSGAGLGTYIGAYAYLNGGRPAEGKKVARGCRRGSYASLANLSPLCVIGNNAPSYATTALAFGICCVIES